MSVLRDFFQPPADVVQVGDEVPKVGSMSRGCGHLQLSYIIHSYSQQPCRIPERLSAPTSLPCDRMLTCTSSWHQTSSTRYAVTVANLDTRHLTSYTCGVQSVIQFGASW
jgi:hypothetical protein